MDPDKQPNKLDLDALEAAWQAATGGKRKETWADSRGWDIPGASSHLETEAAVLGIARNALPDLIARIRELEAEEDRLVEVIGDLMAETTTLKLEREKLDVSTKWRPVESGLPEDRANVLIWDGERVNKSLQRNGIWFSDAFHMPPTHWLPLPAGPEGEA